MDTIIAFFETNEAIIYFVYGLSFFIMGLVVALQSRQSSRLELARSLRWLAGFGILHGLNEWGDLFIPIQASYLPVPALNLLYVLQLLLLALSFTSLLTFGVSLLKPFGVNKWLAAAPTASLAIWVFVAFFVLTSIYHDEAIWRHVSNALARYFIAFPGGLLAAYSLHEYAKQRILPLEVPAVYNALRVCGVALGAYAILGGLITPAIPFWPGSIINSEIIKNWISIPPLVFRTLIGLVLAVSIIHALEIFKLETEQRIESLERDSIVNTERERIARDLHDGALQQVYAAGLLAQSLRKQAAEPLADGLERLILIVNQSIEQLQTFLIEGQAEIQSIEIITALEPIIDEARRVIPIEAHLETLNLTAMTPEKISHIVAFTREALSNAIRHAQTDRVEVRLEYFDNHLRLVIRDFGVGLPENREAGYGSRNMRDRARLLDAELYFESKPGKGTTVILDLPEDKRA